MSVGYARVLQNLLQREWLLRNPETRIRKIPGVRLWVVQDDLLHPHITGNKLRKLDGLLPELKRHNDTDILTCGGLQSAHTLAVAAAAAEHGLGSHLLIRGERPKVPTGNHLLARLFANSVHYVPRSVYADRQAMFKTYTQHISATLPPGSQIVVIQEGAAEPYALLGLLRLVDFLGQREDLAGFPQRLVVDCGTGATAVGLALGVALLDLPWKVVGVMLAGTTASYVDMEEHLAEDFCKTFGFAFDGTLPLEWVERLRPRRFGDILDGDIPACRKVAQELGILLDPIYSLAAWEIASKLAADSSVEAGVLMLHSGGGLGLHGIAQRYPDQF